MNQMDLGGFDTYQQLLAYHKPEREEDAQKEEAQAFGPHVRWQLKRLAMKAKGRSTPCCMYPGCTWPADLEIHHHKFRQFCGLGRLDNGVLLCRPDHRVVASFSLFPSDVKYFHLGRWHPSIDRLKELPLRELEAWMHDSYGFSDFHNERAILAKFNLTARVRQCAQIRQDEDIELSNKIVSWTSLMLAQALVVLVAARPHCVSANGHPRKFVRMLLHTAQHHARYARPDSLFQALLFHMKSINSNALGYLPTASRQAALTENLLKQVSASSMPVELSGGFEDYIRSQNALIMAKASFVKAIELANSAVQSSRDKCPENYVECLCAMVKVNLLLDSDGKRADRLLEEAPMSDRPDKQLKVLATRAYLRLSQGSFGECAAIAEQARKLAESIKRHHTVAKMKQLQHLTENHRDRLKEQLKVARRHGRGLPVQIASDL